MYAPRMEGMPAPSERASRPAQTVKKRKLPNKLPLTVRTSQKSKKCRTNSPAGVQDQAKKQKV